MSLARVKTWSSGEVLNASDLNAEFDNLLNNALSLISPITGTLDLNGNELVLDVDADTSVTADTDDRIDFRIGGTDGMFIGLATGNTGAFLHVDPGAFTATAATDIGLLRIGNTAAVTVPAGVTAVAAGLYIEIPNWTATGTITASATVYIEGAATEGGTDYAVWVDAGDVRIDGDLLTGSTTFNLVNATATTVNFAGGASTALNMGHASGTTTIAGALAVNGASLTTDDTTFALINTTATTLNFAGAATALNVGNASGVTVGLGTWSLPIAQNSQSAAYELVLADAGRHILHPTADNNPRTFTIPANSSVAFPIGTMVTFVNQINTVSIAITTDTMTLAGAGTTGTRTLAANGIATVLKIATTAWIISGTGLS